MKVNRDQVELHSNTYRRLDHTVRDIQYLRSGQILRANSDVESEDLGIVSAHWINHPSDH